MWLRSAHRGHSVCSGLQGEGGFHSWAEPAGASSKPLSCLRLLLRRPPRPPRSSPPPLSGPAPAGQDLYHQGPAAYCVHSHRTRSRVAQPWFLWALQPPAARDRARGAELAIRPRRTCQLLSWSAWGTMRPLWLLLLLSLLARAAHTVSTAPSAGRGENGTTCRPRLWFHAEWRWHWRERRSRSLSAKWELLPPPYSNNRGSL